MKRFLLLAGYLCFSSAFAPAQNSTTIRGSVKLATGDSVEYYHVVVSTLNRSDTVVLDGEMFFEDRFEMKVPAHNPLFVSVSLLGYRSSSIRLDSTASESIAQGLEFVLKPDAFHLQTVTITAKRPPPLSLNMAKFWSMFKIRHCATQGMSWTCSEELRE